ncbi:MAG: type II secretion system F family protein [Planctomycetes bacterium]|nr:type II secretion system F family protein [Planctomycetota bacterium]
MPRFRYTAIDNTGKEISDELDAATLEEAVKQLEASDFRIQNIQEISGSDTDVTSDESESDKSESAEPDSSERSSSGVWLSEKDFLSIGDPIVNMTKAGLPLESGLRALSEEVPSRRMRKTLAAISERLARGEPFEKIVASGQIAAPRAVLELFRSGVAKARLGPLLEEYIEYSRRGTDLRLKVLGGLLYSVVLIVGLAAVLMFYLIWMVPEFAKIFGGFDMELPVITILLINISSILELAGLWVFIGLVVAAFFVWLFALRNKKAFRRRLFCSIPLIGTSFRNSSLATFCHLLALLVENRVSMTAALRVAGIGSRDADIEQSSLQLAAEVEQGARLDEAAYTRRQFPMNLLHVFRWSNREETFPEALHAAGEVFEGQARIQAGLVALVVEQFALIGIALSVGFIVIALFMPLMQMLNDLG